MPEFRKHLGRILTKWKVSDTAHHKEEMMYICTYHISSTIVGPQVRNQFITTHWIRSVLSRSNIALTVGIGSQIRQRAFSYFHFPTHHLEFPFYIQSNPENSRELDRKQSAVTVVMAYLFLESILLTSESLRYRQRFVKAGYSEDCSFLNYKMTQQAIE